MSYYPYAQPTQQIDTDPNNYGLYALILGIVSIVLGWFTLGIPSILAITFGLNARHTNTGSIGMVLGYITVIPSILITWVMFWNAYTWYILG